MIVSPEIRAATSPVFLRRGCVNVIGLDHIREQAGARWERMRETIYARIESILRQTLGPADFFLRLDDTAYIVTMPASDSDHARLCCLRVAHELHTSLLGPCAIAELHISRVSTVGEEIVLDRIVVPELAELAHRAGLRDLLKSETTRLRAAPPGESLSAAAGINQAPYLHGFLAVWDARNEAITTYRLATRRALPAVAPDTDAQARFKEELAATLAGIYFGVGTLARHLESGERFLLNIPVPHEVVSSPIGRMEITATCRNLSGEFRPFLLFELISIPPGVPQSRMGELVAALRPFCRAVLAQVPLRDHRYVAYQAVGLQSIGLALPKSGMSASDSRLEIEKLAAAGKRLSLTTFVLNLPSLDLFASARGEGVSFLSGDFIGGLQPDAGAMHRLPVSQIFGRPDTRAG